MVNHAALAELLAIAFMVAVLALAIVAVPAPKRRDGGDGRGMSADPRAWRGGFYVNPDDPAMFVPKRQGSGWTLNFGHRYTWRLVWLTIGSLVATVVLSTTLNHD
ncbi:DUF5808 domain-containing protein [Dactylosporangium sp. NPDC005555]|uniref:DUF5808 domain-containing protein n=1 Tax=Dactylosporangium sp. NPDC005555 TaxID=3154889 RepID=UPI0033B9507B